MKGVSTLSALPLVKKIPSNLTKLHKVAEADSLAYNIWYLWLFSFKVIIFISKKFKAENYCFNIFQINVSTQNAQLNSSNKMFICQTCFISFSTTHLAYHYLSLDTFRKIFSNPRVVGGLTGKGRDRKWLLFSLYHCPLSKHSELNFLWWRLLLTLGATNVSQCFANPSKSRR